MPVYRTTSLAARDPPVPLDLVVVTSLDELVNHPRRPGRTSVLRRDLLPPSLRHRAPAGRPAPAEGPTSPTRRSPPRRRITGQRVRAQADRRTGPLRRHAATDRRPRRSASRSAGRARRRRWWGRYRAAPPSSSCSSRVLGTLKHRDTSPAPCSRPLTSRSASDCRSGQGRKYAPPATSEGRRPPGGASHLRHVVIIDDGESPRTRLRGPVATTRSGTCSPRRRDDPALLRFTSGEPGRPGRPPRPQAVVAHHAAAAWRSTSTPTTCSGPPPTGLVTGT